MNRAGFDFNLMRALEIFAAVVETRNITHAAQLLGITQSAASQHLHSLERAFDTLLLDRSTRPIELTKAGVLLHGRTGRILSEVEDLRADLVITSDAQYELSGLDRHDILSEAFLLVTPQGFGGEKHDLTALAGQLPLVRFSAHSPVGRRTDQHLRRLRLDLPRVIEADRSSMVTAAVHAGHGFAIMTPTLLLDAVQEGMRLDADPLPAAGFRRTITAVSRSRELADLPRELSLAMAEKLRQAIGDLGDLCARSVSFGASP